jgi:hypothetical protein
MGKAGVARLATQTLQDAQAERSRGNAIQQRAATKASSNYWNGNWDLVDACAVKEFKWEDVKVEDLPEEMKKMTVDERKAFIAKKKAERISCQTKIQELTKKRATFVEAKLKELGEDGDTLDKVVVQTVREQAEAKGYKFAKK